MYPHPPYGPAIGVADSDRTARPLARRRVRTAA